MDEVEDAVATRVEAGDERGPGDRALRRHGRLKRCESAGSRQLLEVRHLALRDQILPPTVNLENQDPETDGMDFVPNQARKAQFDYAMSNSFGFGGTNGALLFKRWE